MWCGYSPRSAEGKGDTLAAVPPANAPIRLGGLRPVDCLRIADGSKQRRPGMFSRKQKLAQQSTASTGRAAPEVEAVNPLSVLEQLSVRLERLAVTDEMSWVRACELVERIDRGARSAASRLMHEYVLGTERSEDVRNEEIWNSVTDYLQKLVHGYRWCLERYERDTASGGAEMLAGVAANAISAGGARLKWAYLRYDAVGPAQWQALKRAYLLAERAGVARDAIEPSGVGSGSSTVEREFLKTMVLAAS